MFYVIIIQYYSNDRHRQFQFVSLFKCSPVGKCNKTNMSISMEKMSICAIEQCLDENNSQKYSIEAHKTIYN